MPRWTRGGGPGSGRRGTGPSRRCGRAVSPGPTRTSSITPCRSPGTALGNCLAELPSFFGNSTVVAVRENGTLCAAVQLSGKRILQALAARNRPIGDDTSLGRALRAWEERYGLCRPAPEETPDFAGSL